MATLNPVRLVEYLGSRDKRAGVDGRPYRFVENKDFNNRRVLVIDDEKAFKFFTEGANASQFMVAKDLERGRESQQFLTLLLDNAAEARKILGISAPKKAKKATAKK
jgi:hypothetical protein|tara:strand:- start:4133 stop:4453 length:321 start_codon:yes stop_codon:yes gene_type:complete